VNRVRTSIGALGAAVCLFAATAEAQSFPDGPGKEAFVAICSSCHDPTHVLDKQLTKAEWQAKVLEMLQEETDVTQADQDAIVAYLAKNFPKKVNANKALAKEIASVLELSDKDAEAIVQYRTEKGDFKTLDDLKKVPGLDVAKIEGIKQRIEF
jgi:competence protein ComEA